MSNRVLTWVWDNSDASGSDLLLILALADQSNDEGWSWPSKATLLKKTRLSVNTLDRAIARNLEAGRIQRIERAGSSNRYRVMTSEPSPMVGDPQIAPSPTVGVTGDPHGGGGGDPHGGGVEPSLNPKDEPTLFPTTSVVAASTSPKITPRATGAVVGFDQFWDAYPKKADKGAARKAWPKALAAVGGPANVAVIIRGALVYRNDPDRDPKFTKNPATWLNAEAWANEVQVEPVQRSPWDVRVVQ